MNPTEQEVTYLEDGVIATFSIKPKLNNFIFETTGNKEFTNQEFVSIRIPGDKMTEVVEEVMPHHKHRFKNTYKAFKEGTSFDSGTPLVNFPDLDPATLEKLKYLGITTIEMLAGVNDSLLGNIGSNGRELRDRAMRYIDSSAKDRTSETILKQNEEIQAMKAQIEKLMNTNEEEPKKGPGRPKLTLPPHMDELSK